MTQQLLINRRTSIWIIWFFWLIFCNYYRQHTFLIIFLFLRQWIETTNIYNLFCLIFNSGLRQNENERGGVGGDNWTTFQKFLFSDLIFFFIDLIKVNYSQSRWCPEFSIVFVEYSTRMQLNSKFINWLFSLGWNTFWETKFGRKIPQ
jgi:hypothetical protein